MSEKNLAWCRYRLLTVREDMAHLEVGRGEPDDGRLVQLRGDGGGQRQQLGQLQELGILLLSPTARRILALFLHGSAAWRDRAQGYSLENKADTIPSTAINNRGLQNINSRGEVYKR